MQYFAAAAMLGIYLYNMPLKFAFIWRAHRFGFGFGIFERRAALRRAEKRLGKSTSPKKRMKLIPGRKHAAQAGAKFTPGRLKFAAQALARLLSRLKVESFSARLLIGAGDAACTALVCGAVMSLGHALRGAADIGQVDIRPEFSGSCFEGEIRAVVALRAGDILSAAALGALKNIRQG